MGIAESYPRVKLFHLYRNEDESGVSGTGPVVEGVEFTNGWVALRWLSNKSSICFYSSLEDVRSIHGHGGKTDLVLHDFVPVARNTATTTPGGGRRFELLLQIIEEATLITDSEDPEAFGPTGQNERPQALVRLRSLIDDLESTFSRGNAA